MLKKLRQITVSLKNNKIFILKLIYNSCRDRHTGTEKGATGRERGMGQSRKKEMAERGGRAGEGRGEGARKTRHETGQTVKERCHSEMT